MEIEYHRENPLLVNDRTEETIAFWTSKWARNGDTENGGRNRKHAWLQDTGAHTRGWCIVAERSQRCTQRNGTHRSGRIAKDSTFKDSRGTELRSRIAWGSCDNEGTVLVLASLLIERTRTFLPGRRTTDVWSNRSARRDIFVRFFCRFFSDFLSGVLFDSWNDSSTVRDRLSTDLQSEWTISLDLRFKEEASIRDLSVSCVRICLVDRP